MYVECDRYDQVAANHCVSIHGLLGRLADSIFDLRSNQ